VPDRPDDHPEHTALYRGVLSRSDP
jgi:hypothetical protein